MEKSLNLEQNSLRCRDEEFFVFVGRIFFVKGIKKSLILVKSTLRFAKQSYFYFISFISIGREL